MQGEVLSYIQASSLFKKINVLKLLSFEMLVAREILSTILCERTLDYQICIGYWITVALIFTSQF